MPYINIGYGIDVSHLHLKDNAAFLILQEHMPNTIGEYYRDTCCDDNGNIFSLTPNTAKMFAEDYENDTYCYRGFWGMLTDIINEERDLTGYCFTFEDQCLYVPSHVPEDNQSKEAMLTQQDVKRILEFYLRIVTDDPLNFSFVEIILP